MLNGTSALRRYGQTTDSVLPSHQLRRRPQPSQPAAPSQGERTHTSSRRSAPLRAKHPLPRQHKAIPLELSCFVSQHFINTLPQFDNPSDVSRCGGLRSINTKTLVDASRLPLALAAVAPGNARLMMTLLSARSRKASLRRGGGASLWKDTMPAAAPIKTPWPRLPPTVSYTWSTYACKWTH